MLLKEGGLTEEEFGWIRMHPEWGWTAIRNVDDFGAPALSYSIITNGWMAAAIPVIFGYRNTAGLANYAVADSYDCAPTDRPLSGKDVRSSSGER